MNDDKDTIAPVIPLFGGQDRDQSAAGMGSDATRPAGPQRSAVQEWNVPGADFTTGATGGVVADRSNGPRLRALQLDGDRDADAKVEQAVGEILVEAEEVLVRKLRARSLSITEARALLRGFASGDSQLTPEQVEDIIDDSVRRGYLDDAALAEQLVSAGVGRKGQGRIALARSLAQRGISRDVIDEALDTLPDDDLERAIEFAQTKMRSLARLDQETAKRRLSGQLARRGYPGNVVSAALRAVMQNQRPSARPSGVRFE